MDRDQKRDIPDNCRLSRKAGGQLKKLPTQDKMLGKKMLAAIRRICRKPDEGKVLRDPLFAEYKAYKVEHGNASYRIVYKKLKDAIHVEIIGPRRTVYDDLRRYLEMKSNLKKRRYTNT